MVATFNKVTRCYKKLLLYLSAIVSGHGKKEGGTEMCLVPVRIYHEDRPENEVLVYAMLDECSLCTFIREDLLQMFDAAKKMKTTITTSTLNGEETSYTYAVDGLVVSDVQRFTKIFITSQ